MYVKNSTKIKLGVLALLTNLFLYGSGLWIIIELIVYAINGNKFNTLSLWFFGVGVILLILLTGYVMWLREKRKEEY
jgi:hypothetical protein